MNRFERELLGDFREIDAYIRGQRIKMILVATGIVACCLLAWWLP